VRHDGGRGGVNLARRVGPFLGQPGAARILAQHGVADVAGQPRVARVRQLAVDDGARLALGRLMPRRRRARLDPDLILLLVCAGLFAALVLGMALAFRVGR
jgi:hypothetical protein